MTLSLCPDQALSYVDGFFGDVSRAAIAVWGTARTFFCRGRGAPTAPHHPALAHVLVHVERIGACARQGEMQGQWLFPVRARHALPVPGGPSDHALHCPIAPFLRARHRALGGHVAHRGCAHCIFPHRCAPALTLRLRQGRRSAIASVGARRSITLRGQGMKRALPNASHVAPKRLRRRHRPKRGRQGAARLEGREGAVLTFLLVPPLRCTLAGIHRFLLASLPPQCSSTARRQAQPQAAHTSAVRAPGPISGHCATTLNHYSQRQVPRLFLHIWPGGSGDGKGHKYGLLASHNCLNLPRTTPLCGLACPTTAC